ncbi:MAG: alpha/beta hydrolase [Anaerolineales bacterium]
MVSANSRIPYEFAKISANSRIPYEFAKISANSRIPYEFAKISANSRIPALDFGGEGPELLFLHANGYPPACYHPLLERLVKDFHVTAMLQRPLWDGSHPADIRDWMPLTDDLLRYLDAHHPGPVACVGHSMGGIVALRAALREPQRFSSLVLLDPVLFPPYFIRLWQIFYRLGLGDRLHPLVDGAKRRRRQFDDLERLFDGYRRKSIFRYFDDQALRAYVEGIACKTEAGPYQLCYSPEWEARIYVTGVWRDMDLWHGLPHLQTPTLIVRGGETDTFWERTGNLVKRKQPQVRVEALPRSTHLVPLERPNEVSALIRTFLKEQP